MSQIDPNTAPAERPSAIYLTASELADALGCSKATIYRLAENPAVPCLRLGGLVRFPRERVLAFFRGAEQGARSVARRSRKPTA